MEIMEEKTVREDANATIREIVTALLAIEALAITQLSVIVDDVDGGASNWEDANTDSFSLRDRLVEAASRADYLRRGIQYLGSRLGVGGANNARLR